MATATPLFFNLLFFFFLISGGTMSLVKGQAAGQASWCVAKPSASDQELRNNIDYACRNINCDKTQPGGPCYDPQTLINKASVVMNIYYQQNGRHIWNCNFTNSGLISITDPSYGNCKYDMNDTHSV